MKKKILIKRILFIALSLVMLLCVMPLTSVAAETDTFPSLSDTIPPYAQWLPQQYIVSFDTNGGAAVDSIDVTLGEKYGNLPSSAITGLSGGSSNWYLVDENGNVTDTNIKKLTKVSVERDHTLFVKRTVLKPNISIQLAVPGGISDNYQYYIPGASQRILTATVSNMNTDVLDYTYRWYKDGTAIEGASTNILTLDGNVSDSGTYTVEVTASLKDGTNIVVTENSAMGSKEQKVKILHAANTLSYDANGGEGGPSSGYTGGTTLAVSNNNPSLDNHIFLSWNTEMDGSGTSYSGGDSYTFIDDNGNGGCTVKLYAQWKAVEHTVTYVVNGETYHVMTIEHGKDITLPPIPQKEGHIGKWDHDGKNITADTQINAVYTIDEYTITFNPTSNDIQSPQTGDNSNLWLWWILLIVSAIGVSSMTMHDSKRKAENQR